jgi:F-type H+-transporting ATPase subunit delta
MFVATLARWRFCGDHCQKVVDHVAANCRPLSLGSEGCVVKILMLGHEYFRKVRPRSPCVFASQNSDRQNRFIESLLCGSFAERFERQAVAQEQTIVSGMAGRYAQALFALAQEQNSVERVAAELSAFQALIEQSADLRYVIRSPIVPADVQAKALAAILKRANVTGISSNFLRLVATKRRLFAVPKMIKGYLALADQARGVVRAEVTVAEPLNESHLAALQSALQEVAGGKSVDVAVKVDSAIVGGLIVKLGSRMIDSSLKTKLETIRARMKGVA